jgi:hypothetical protein
LWLRCTGFAGKFPAESLHGPDNVANALHRNPTFLTYPATI